MNLLARHLPAPRSRVLEVGRDPGVYAVWPAERGHDVRLLDPVPLHVEQACAAGAGVGLQAALGDARNLQEEDASVDAVLLVGPLYHLTERGDRITALREARRVLRSGGVLAAVGISRYASAMAFAHGGSRLRR